MSVQREGEVVFGAGDWVQTNNGVSIGIKIRHFEAGQMTEYIVAQIYERVGSALTLIDDVQILDRSELTGGNVANVMTKILTKLRAWLARRFPAGSTLPPPTQNNVAAFAAAIDAEVQKIRFQPGNPPTVLYP